MYRIAKGSRGDAPFFSVVVGLREEYGALRLHDVEEAIDVIKHYIMSFPDVGYAFLAGVVAAGEIVCPWPETLKEPCITFSGNIDPSYPDAAALGAAENFLNGLASRLAEEFKRLWVHIVYDGEMWTLQLEDETAKVQAVETAVIGG